MLTDWIYWLSCLHPEQLLSFLIGLLLTDGPRYALSKLVFFFLDWLNATWN